MTTPLAAPSPETVAYLRELAERPLSPEEYEARAKRTIEPEELEEVISLISWFSRRYPTVKERLDYVRHATARWTRRPEAGV